MNNEPVTRELEACALVPLRQNVRWCDLSYLFPGRIVEEERLPPGHEGEGKFGAVDIGSSEAAARLVEAHNAALENLRSDNDGK